MRVGVRTFRSRLASSATLLAVTMLAATGGAIYLGAREALHRNLDGALFSIARAELSSALDGHDGRVHIHEEQPAALGLAPGSGYEKFAEIRDLSGAVLAHTENMHTGPTLTANHFSPLGSNRREFVDLFRGPTRFRGIRYSFHDRRGVPLMAVVAVPTAPMERGLASLTLVLTVAVFFGAGVSAWAAGRLARRLTRPLERIAATAREVGGGRLSERVPDVSPDQELREVSEVLNGMLDRLEDAFHRQDQLIESQRRFVADASHELRSPLSNLRGTVEVALRRPRSAEDYRETLEASRTEIERLCRLVNDLLTLSRTDAGPMQLAREWCNLAEIAEQAVRLHALRASENRVRLEQVAPQPIWVQVDAARIRQVLDNLLDNALRHSPPNTTVTLTVAAAGDHAEVTVADQGPGLSPEHLDRVFDRFYRVDAARARDAGGLGLGLAISRALAESHGGALTASATPGAGAVFTLSLPLPPEKPGDPTRLVPHDTHRELPLEAVR